MKSFERPKSLTELVSEELLVKVDFNICRLAGLMQALLGKLGSLQVSAESILGRELPLELGDVTESFDELFPDVGQFLNGVLEDM